MKRMTKENQGLLANFKEAENQEAWEKARRIKSLEAEILVAAMAYWKAKVSHDPRETRLLLDLLDSHCSALESARKR